MHPSSREVPSVGQKETTNEVAVSPPPLPRVGDAPSQCNPPPPHMISEGRR